MSGFCSQLVRGSKREDLIPPFVAYCCHTASHLGNTESVGHLCSKIITSLGLAWAVCSYKGFKASTWLKDWSAEAFIPIAQIAINSLLGYACHRFEGIKKYEEDINCFFMTAVFTVQAYAYCVLEKTRNPSLPFEPLAKYSVAEKCLPLLGYRYLISKCLVPFLLKKGMIAPRDESIKNATRGTYLLLFMLINILLIRRYPIKESSLFDPFAFVAKEIDNLFSSKLCFNFVLRVSERADSCLAPFFRCKISEALLPVQS